MVETVHLLATELRCCESRESTPGVCDLRDGPREPWFGVLGFMIDGVRAGCLAVQVVLPFRW